MMDFGQMVEILSQLSLSAIATFLAILLWSNTRDTAWMFIVMGIILWFGRVMYSTLELFGIVEGEIYVIAGLSLVRVVFFNLPYIFFIIAFVIMIARNRMRYETVSAELKKREREEKKQVKRRTKEEAKSIEAPQKEQSSSEGSTEPEEDSSSKQKRKKRESKRRKKGEDETGTSEAEPLEEAEDLEEVEEAEDLEEVEELEEADDDEESK